ncbi:hypothetical protein AB0M91_25255 [Micromonospora rifamycinica]|uniref:hypothetical protein n=1 Tax=Micromonospora rifamycinica TaxID=291594 RepID=UPI003415F5DB
MLVLGDLGAGERRQPGSSQAESARACRRRHGHTQVTDGASQPVQVLGDGGSRADQGVFADRDAGEDDRAGADRGE